MKNPFFACRRYEHFALPSETVRQALAATGGNTGNLLFIHALSRVVKCDDYQNSVSFDPRAIRERHDGIIVPAANWLNGHSKWGGLARLIELSKLPCVVVGLGAQSSSFESYPTLTEGTERLLRIAAERCHSISVRGEYSAETLNRYGVKNIAITGCPSLLWHVTKPASVNKGAVAERISVCGTRGNDYASISQGDLRHAVSLLISRDAYTRKYDYIAQTEWPDISYALDRFESPEQQMELQQFLSKVYAASGTPLAEYLTRHVKTFFRVPDWIEYLKTRQFTLGTRLHGIVSSMLAGTPAMLVTHDTRTSEAAKHLCLPTISAEALVRRRALNAEELFASLDLSAFNQRMPVYYAAFRKYFEQNDVATNLVDCDTP